jgi:UDP-N-acetylglucosamine 2-epimerase (non-hydrolysing)
MKKSRTKLTVVAGARPNFMKIAPIIRELRKHEDAFDWSLVHTGQHYDHGMSEVFFEELGIPPPNFHMGAGGGGHAEQTARVMISFENYCIEQKPDMVLVVGDVNSTLACAIVAKKLNIRVVHVEAGLRSGDMSMPEEINRIVTDSISDLFFVTEPSGVENLKREGHADETIHFVGHVMIDNLFYQLKQLVDMDANKFPSNVLKTELGQYGVVTLHRPSNVDDPQTLRRVIGALSEVGKQLPLIFAIHPRTAGNLDKFSIPMPPSIIRTTPLPYMEFLNLWKDARVILTDSGGIQEESTALGIPCITLRENTERPVTVDEGTNLLVGTNSDAIIGAASTVFARERNATIKCPALWDGKAAIRIVAILEQFVP